MHKHKTLLLISNSYQTILPLFKSMVLIFEQKEPHVHKLRDMMINNLQRFVACFIKFEVIKDLSSKQFKKSEYIRKHPSPQVIFVGNSNEKIIDEMLKNKNDSEIVKEFFDNLSSACTVAGVYLQKEYAIDDKLFIFLSALDPIARGHSKTHSSLLKLKTCFNFTLSYDDVNFTAEVSNYQNYLITNSSKVFSSGGRLDT